MKVMIGVPTAEMARRADFYDYFNLLDKPEGTIISFAHGQSPARNRNLMIKTAIEKECTHILFLDDDLAFKPDMLNRLLAHDKDIVGGYYLMRNYPHKPIVFSWANEEGRCLHLFPTDNMTGLVECVALGLGAVLIKTSVFQAMHEELKDSTWVRLGELENDHWCDDIGLWKRVRDYGFKMYCDLDVLVGHMAQVTIWPDRQSEKWMVAYDTQSEDGRVAFPAIQPDPVPDLAAVNG